MKKTHWLILLAIGILASLGQSRADEPKKEEAPKKETKQTETKQTETKQAEKKKESPEQRMERRKKAIEKAVANEDWDQVLAGLDEIIDDKEINADDQLHAMLDKFTVLAEEKLDGAKACPLAKKLAERGKNDPDLLNDLSWTILDTEGLKNPDLDLALELAQKAVELTHEQSGEILDTLARAHYAKGDLDKAVELQTKAVDKLIADNAAPDDVKEEVQAALEKYKTKQAEAKSEKK
jgi:tetratricopeptide (TPR) repeat protein